MRAFNNDPKIKEFYVNRVKAHAEADEIVQGKYWENGRGCAVGCTIEGSDHAKYETELGVPQILARLQDRIFEGLELSEAKQFPLQFLDAIEVGADLELVFYRFMHRVLSDKDKGTINYAGKNKQVVQDVIDLLFKKTQNLEVTQKEWEKARTSVAFASSASSASYSASSAAYAVASTSFAVEVANSAYASSVSSAADAVAYSAACKNHFLWMKTVLLEELGKQ